MRLLLALTIVLTHFGARASAQRVTLGASGDVLAHLRVISSAQHHGGWDHVFALSEPAADDVAFVNLETPLSMVRPPETGDPPILGAPAELAVSLARMGIDIVSVANNHAYDQRATGAAQSLDALSRAGVAWAGAGPDRGAAFAATRLVRNGVRLGFVAVTERINASPMAAHPECTVAQWLDDQEMASALQNARHDVDILVVSIHWSHDFWTEPTPAQRARAAWLVAHGADVILGHGPHVLHRVERMSSPRGDAMCAYSLGNFISNQGMRYRVGRRSYGIAHRATYLPQTRDGAWLRTELELQDGRLHIAEITAVPLFTYNNYRERVGPGHAEEDIRLQYLRDVADPALRDERRGAIVRALGPEVRVLE